MRENEKRLIEILEEELRIYEEIQEVKRLERQAVLDFSTPLLEDAVLAQERLTNRAERIEEERRELVLGLASSHGEWDRDPTLREIAPGLSPQARSKVEKLARSLSALCVNVSREQFTNTSLISRSAGYVRDLMETLLLRTQGPAVAYGPNGFFTPAKESAPGFLDRKI
jgi:hypothetical protein